ncbi:nucleotidyltransferase family protein [Chelativorans sp. Marseille-P2723]|uniref:nucleotidyltransferase family protein n=1 Tax=Chelativorans sp. Marseille-P2723 TaxID=2709133 RepID=UPI00156FE7B7|nr:nucleotidyltransferase family protein [Chelativorans sp. Marseille-P2723]
MARDPDVSTIGTTSIVARAAPVLDSVEAEAFYADVIQKLLDLGSPFLVAGTFAVSAYTGISRVTKDFDIFCKAGDAQRILAHFQNLGETAIIEDDRWLAKVKRGPLFFDIIYASSNGTMLVSDIWFEHARTSNVLGHQVQLVGPTELVWSKCFIQNRHRYDGADVAHLILRAHEQIDWKRLLQHMEAHWEVLLIHLLNFRWIYPSERNKVPGWLLEELLDRLSSQRQLPPPQARICRGRMFSTVDYEIDVHEWGYADIDTESGSKP